MSQSAQNSSTWLSLHAATVVRSLPILIQHLGFNGSTWKARRDSGDNIDVSLRCAALLRTDEVGRTQRRCSEPPVGAIISSFVHKYCPPLSGQQKMNTGPNPEMTELAMMTNVPAGRTAGSTIPHCHQDGLSHVTQRAAGFCFSRFFIQKLLIIIDSKKRDTFLSLLIHLSLTKQTHFQPLLHYYICDGVLYVNNCF